MKVDACSIYLETSWNPSVWHTQSRRLLLYYYSFQSSRAATILYHLKQTAEAMWGRLATCGRLAIGLPRPARSPRPMAVGLPLAALWGRMASCGGLATRLPVICTTAASQGPIANRPQDAILPRIAASRKRRSHSSGTVGAAGRPIANRLQVANLPHIASATY